MFRATVRGREPMVLGWSTTSSTRPCLESLPSIVRMAFSSCFNGLSYRVFPSWSRACAWCALLPTSRPTHTSMSSGVIIVPPVMKVFRSPRARRSPDARAAPTLRRDLRHAPLKRPCSRPGSYQRSSGVPVPGDNTPPDHRRQGRKVIPEPATRPRPSGPTKHGNGLISSPE